MRITFDDKARLLIPVEIRKKAGFAAGDPVSVEVVRPGEIRVIRLQEVVRETRGMYSHLKTAEEDVTEDFLRERKTEAAQEVDE